MALEFTYDATTKALTATTDCYVNFTIKGAGGGHGGTDSPYNGSRGLDGTTISGRVYLAKNEVLYCAVGSGGYGGQTTPGSGGSQGGSGGYGLDGFSGGRGGNAGYSGWSGGGAGGGAATVLYKIVNGQRQYIAIAAGGGGGGGGGHHAPGYVRSYSPYGIVPGSGSRGGYGQNHLGDGGGPGGGGGGYYGGQGGLWPGGDVGGMSGSTGYSYNIGASSTVIGSPSSYGGGSLSTSGNGANGYAAIESVQTDITVRSSDVWTTVQNVYYRQSDNWTTVNEIFYRSNDQWTRLYGNNLPTYVSTAGGFNNTTGPMNPY